MAGPALAGRTAVVTGASSGIGRATALTLAESGADVLVHAGRNREGAEQTAAEIGSLGGNAQVFVVDLNDPNAATQLIEFAWNWRDDISIWVNNAGADVLTGTAADWTFNEKLDVLYQVDLRSGIELARLAGAKLREGRQTRGISDASLIRCTIGWDQAQIGMAGDSGEMFAAIKGAVMAFTGSLAKSLAPEVRVNCVAPGWIKTAWGEDAPEYWKERAVKESLLNRWGAAQDVANAVHFLVSQQASFITGQTLAVNGGFRHQY